MEAEEDEFDQVYRQVQLGPKISTKSRCDIRSKWKRRVRQEIINNFECLY